MIKPDNRLSNEEAHVIKRAAIQTLFHQKNYETARANFNRAKLLFEEQGNSNEACSCDRFIAACYGHQKLYKEAVDHLVQMEIGLFKFFPMGFSLGFPVFWRMMNRVIGNSMESRDIQHYRALQVEYAKNGESAKEAICLIIIALCNFRLKRYEDALSGCQKTTEIYQKAGKTEYLFHSELSVIFCKNQISPAETATLYEELANKYLASDNHEKASYTLICLAEFYASQSMLNKAIDYYEKAETWAPDDWFEFNTAIARCYKRFHLGNKAVEYYQKARNFYAESDNLLNVAHIESEIGQLHLGSLQQPEQAISYFREAQKKFEELGNSQQGLNCLEMIGRCYEKLPVQQTDLAIASFQEVQKKHEELGNIQQVDHMDQQITSLMDSASHEALKYLENRLVVYKKTANLKQIALCYSRLGNFFNMNFRPSEALSYFRNALECYESIDDQQQIANTNGYIADCYRQLQQVDKAVDYLQKKQVVLDKLGNYEQAARCNSEIGRCLGNLDQLENAIKYHQREQKFFRKRGDLQPVAVIDSTIGSLLLQKNYPAEAIACFVESQKKHYELDDFLQAAQASLNLADCYSRLGQDDKTIKYLEQAQRHFKNEHNISRLAGCHRNIALCYGDRLHQTEKAIEHSKKAYKLYEELNDIQQCAQCNTYIARFYWNKGQKNKAETYYRKAQNAYEKLNDNIQIAQIERNIGRLFQHTISSKALISFISARDAFEKLGNINQQSRCEAEIGSCYTNMGLESEAIEHYRVASQQAIQFYRSTFHKGQQDSIIQLCAEWHRNIASSFERQGAATKAVEWYMLASLTYQLIGDRPRAKSCLKEINQCCPV